ncbi:MAG TPA: ATP-binding cassette domain-containing protein, partial [Polyangiaceae bacterium]|nr:ATP-binding cassette domain-containing protein [Polyangiaceae bacterium]
MAKIELRGVAHSYAPRGAAGAERAYALKPLDLTWESGGAYALLGPSGCGKTTLLNIMSGLVRPSEGAIVIDGVDVTAAPPEVRNVAQVFQFPVIYDTMTVFENLAFPLRNRGVGRREAAARVEQ